MLNEDKGLCDIVKSIDDLLVKMDQLVLIAKAQLDKIIAERCNCSEKE